MESTDVIVIGGGPAGLAAALWLARYRLDVRLFDREQPRNAPTWAVHGYLGLPHIAPMELRRLGQEQAEAEGARLEVATVETVEGEKDRFTARLSDGRAFASRRLLFATGVRDIIPEIPGLQQFYGTSIWHCPDCDGPTATGRHIGVIGWGREIVAFCMGMLTWTDRITLLTHGHAPNLPDRAREALERFSIPIRTEVILGLQGEEGQVQRALFVDGPPEEFDLMFFNIAFGPGSSLPASLGCEADEEGALLVDASFETTVPGVYAAGDITPGSKLAIQAAADGTRAAIGIYKSLIPEERKV